MDDVLEALKAVAEPTRLRIVAIVSRTELTVNELCTVLGQSQPRVSRHLKLLCDAGVLSRHSEGTSAFFRPRHSGIGRDVADAVLPLLDTTDPTIARDGERLDAIRAERGAAANAYFESIARDWDAMRELHVADAVVEEALLDAVAGMNITDLIDIGTGTGRILEIFADHIGRGLGIDLSREMLNLARSHLDEHGLSHCSVRYGNVYDLDIEPESIDVAVLHHVLHYLDNPRDAIVEAARTLREGGRLLVVDFAPHDVESLRTDFAHRRLGFSDTEIRDWCSGAGLDVMSTSHFLPDGSTDPALGVSLWVTSKPEPADGPLDQTTTIDLASDEPEVIS